MQILGKIVIFLTLKSVKHSFAHMICTYKCWLYRLTRFWKTKWNAYRCFHCYKSFVFFFFNAIWGTVNSI